MKVLVLLGLVAAACANIAPEPIFDPSYSIIAEQLIPLGDKIRQAEERMASQRIVGGIPAVHGQFPYKAGLLASFQNIAGTGVCGGSLIAPARVLTAAHCWFDGVNQAWRFTVVLGSVLLFSGGTRIDTSVVIMHQQWTPSLIRNDVAVIYLPSAVPISATISPISLPSGSLVDNNFSGHNAVAAGYGITQDGNSITQSQSLSHVIVNVISNLQCSLSFPLIVQSSNICTSTAFGGGTCSGDSGGPLTIISGGEPVLIGVVSFGSASGCLGGPSVFARVTSFLPFIEQHLQ